MRVHVGFHVAHVHMIHRTTTSLLDSLQRILQFLDVVHQIVSAIDDQFNGFAMLDDMRPNRLDGLQ